MGEKSKIEWTDNTFNPWMGCSHVSPGYDHCYAEVLCERYKHAMWGAHEDRIRTANTNWRKPIAWDRKAAEASVRSKVFCASLADIFDNKAPAAWRADLFELIKATPNLDWQLLTKRPTNIAKMVPPDWGQGYANVWLGSTAENQEEYERRWPILAAIPAKIRFLSYEPAVGPLVLADGPQPEWLICGGESGGGARMIDSAWARAIRDDCKRRGVAFFMKQWGTYRSNPLCLEQGLKPVEAKGKDANGKGGGLLDGELWREFPNAA